MNKISNSPGFWTFVRFEAEPEQEEFASWVMIECGAKGCETEIQKNGKVSLKASFETSTLTKEVMSELVARLEEYGLADYLHTLQTEKFDDQNWFEKWKEYFEPFLVGDKFIVCPPWRKDELKVKSKTAKDRLIVYIDPGMAFGTGLHATTQYCLKTIGKYDLGVNLIDIGTGSGILAITAALINDNLAITAIDNNTHAIENARENIALNELEKRIDLIETEPNKIVGKKKFDTILSNITCEDIISLLPIYLKLLADGGKIICAGILHNKIHLLEQAFEQHSFAKIDQEVTGEWVGATFSHSVIIEK